MSESSRPMLLYRILQVIAYVGALPFLANTVDIVLHPTAPTYDVDFNNRIVTGLIAAPLSLLIGVLCARRVRENVIGWLLITFAYGVTCTTIRRDWLPLATGLMIVNIGTIFWLSLMLIPLYFPNGRLFPSWLNRWGNKLVAVGYMIFIAGPLFFGRTVSYGNGPTLISAPNPLVIVDFDSTMIAVLITGVCVLFAPMSLFLRYRHSSTLERLQLRWLLVGIVVQLAFLMLTPQIAGLTDLPESMVAVSLFLIIPATVGVAILRYRLYDIDIIIRRTFIYSILTAILAAIYFGGVIIVQQVLKPLTASSDLAIVLSTLGIAALFNPLRHRIQNTIDRHFFRRKYDAQKTLEAFNTAIRDEVDLDTLQAALVGVVQVTMQPKKVSLWLRNTETEKLS